MGVRIEAGEGESIADALRRLRKELCAGGGIPLFHGKWHKKRHDLYQRPSVYRRRRRWVTAVRRRGGGLSSPDPGYDWADDLELRPRVPWASP